MPFESVDSKHPPARRLDALFEKATRRGYKKVAYGKDLFARLDPQTAYTKCPRLKALLADMLG